MKIHRLILFISAASALVVWLFYGPHLYQAGFSASPLLSNGATISVTLELGAFVLVYLIWSFNDATELGIRRFWLLSLFFYLIAVPLPFAIYVYMRNKALIKVKQ